MPLAVRPRVPVTFQRVGPEAAGELASVMGFADPAAVSQRFDLGRHCYIGRCEGQPVTYGWITFDEEVIGGLDLHVRLLPGEAYIWDCATLPAYRSQGLYPALLAWMQRELQRTGYQRIWIGMDAGNLPSQVGVARAGFQHVVDILQVRNAPARTFLARPAPGALQKDVLAARYALFGDREASRITLPRT
ncbi:MAG TPA: GNAT family N-acetyltransferase [Ktedonobacteraceae bacterium]